MQCCHLATWSSLTLNKQNQTIVTSCIVTLLSYLVGTSNPLKTFSSYEAHQRDDLQTSLPIRSDCEQLNQPLLDSVFPLCQTHLHACQMEDFGQCLLDYYPQTRGTEDIFASIFKPYIFFQIYYSKMQFLGFLYQKYSCRGFLLRQLLREMFVKKLLIFSSLLLP